MDGLTSRQTIHRAQILYAIPISAESFITGFEAHSFSSVRMHAFRLCMQRTTRVNRLALPEELICAIEKYVRAAGIEYGVQYAQAFICRRAGAVAKAAAEREAWKQRASRDPLGISKRFIEDEKQYGDENLRRAKRPGVSGHVLRYLAAIFNLAIAPSHRGGNDLYLCLPWWPVPRTLDLARWHEEKSARPEMSDIFAYFGWDDHPSAQVMMADDPRARRPSKGDVVRLNEGICALGLEVVAAGRRGGVVRVEGERGDERGRGRVRRGAVGDNVTKESISVDYVDDPATGRTLWQPRRLLFNSVETY